MQATARKLLDEGGVCGRWLCLLSLPPLRRKLQGNVLDEGNGQGSYPTDCHGLTFFEPAAQKDG